MHEPAPGLPLSVPGLSRRAAFGGTVFAGLAIALGQSPFSLFWLAFPGLMAAVALGALAPDARSAARRGWLVGFSFAALAMSWIVEPFFVDMRATGWMAPFALFFMAAGFGLFWGAGFWLARRLAPHPGGAAWIAVPLGWLTAELARSYLFSGFPWALVSYIWIDTPLLQLFALIGPQGMTLATLLMAALAALALVRRRPGLLALPLALLAAAWVWGAWMQARPVPGDDAVRPLLRLIQPNASQREKWDPAMMPVFFERQLAFSAEPAPRRPDLIIWPEVAVPFLLNDPSAPFGRIAEAAGGVPLVLGAQRLQGGQAFNSLAVIGEGGEIGPVYDKHHLVPFGEFLPGAAVLERLGLRALAAQFGTGYTPGRGPRLLDLGPLGRALPLICYEAIFPHDLTAVRERADWLLQITNDAWFGQMIGPWQHLAQARARAVELGLPMVRVANTGVSAVIDARGNTKAMLGLGETGWLDAELPPPLPRTPYAVTGDSVVFFLLLALSGLVGWQARRKVH